MKNKRGFTLIELLAVIAIIALISLIAIPNIVGLSTGIRKDQMLADAKKLISLAQYQVSKSYSIRVNPPHTFTFTELNLKGDIGKDPDGGNYSSESYVTYEDVGGVAKYCITLIGSKRSIGVNGCIYEDNLYSKSNVVDNEE